MYSIENYITLNSARNLTPFGKGGRSVDFEVPAAVKMTFLIEMVVDRSVGRGELLKRFRAPKFRHRALSSSERLMLIFSPIVEPAIGPLTFGVSEDFHRRRKRPKQIRHDHFLTTVSFHRFM